MPVQCNRDEGIGPFEAERSTTNFQPVVPIALGEGRWTLISRTVVPFVEQDGGPAAAQPSGVGDVAG